jgi:hypothetical protein
VLSAIVNHFFIWWRNKQTSKESLDLYVKANTIAIFSSRTLSPFITHAIIFLHCLKKPARVLPGFNITLGFTLLYLSLIVLIPLSALVFKTFTLTWDQFWSAVTGPRVLASYRLTFGASFACGIGQCGIRTLGRLGTGAV